MTTDRAMMMSRKLRLVTAIMADRELSAAAKCVAAVLLLKFHNATSGRCNPAYSRLADATGRKRRATITAVQELEAAGWLEVEGTKGGSVRSTNSFRFAFDRIERGAVNDTGAVHDTGAADDIEGVQSATPHGCSPRHPRGAVDDTPGVQRTAHEPFKEPSGSREPEEEREVDLALSPAGRPGGGGLKEEFEEFWRCYPRREGRKKAEEAYRLVVEAGEATPAELLAGAMRYGARRMAETEAGDDPKWTLGPTKWLDEHHWKDQEPPAGAPRDRGSRSGGFSFMDQAINGFQGDG